MHYLEDYPFYQESVSKTLTEEQTKIRACALTKSLQTSPFGPVEFSEKEAIQCARIPVCFGYSEDTPVEKALAIDDHFNALWSNGFTKAHAWPNGSAWIHLDTPQNSVVFTGRCEEPFELDSAMRLYAKKFSFLFVNRECCATNYLKLLFGNFHEAANLACSHKALGLFSKLHEIRHLRQIHARHQPLKEIPDRPKNTYPEQMTCLGYYTELDADCAALESFRGKPIEESIRQVVIDQRQISKLLMQPNYWHADNIEIMKSGRAIPCDFASTCLSVSTLQLMATLHLEGSNVSSLTDQDHLHIKKTISASCGWNFFGDEDRISETNINRARNLLDDRYIGHIDVALKKDPTHLLTAVRQLLDLQAFPPHSPENSLAGRIVDSANRINPDLTQGDRPEIKARIMKAYNPAPR